MGSLRSLSKTAQINARRFLAQETASDMSNTEQGQRTHFAAGGSPNVRDRQLLGDERLPNFCENLLLCCWFLRLRWGNSDRFCCFGPAKIWEGNGPQAQMRCPKPETALNSPKHLMLLVIGGALADPRLQLLGDQVQTGAKFGTKASRLKPSTQKLEKPTQEFRGWSASTLAFANK